MGSLHVSVSLLIINSFSRPSLESQEVKLATAESPDNSQLLDSAIEASNVVISGVGLLAPPESPLLLRAESSSDNAAFEEQQSPPEYPTDGSVVVDGDSKGKSTKRFFSSLTHSFQAVTSGMRAKPEPMVIAMCQSAKAGNLGHLKGFLAQGANINGKNDEGYTSLICAIRANQIEAVEFLLQAGASRSTSDSRAGKRKPPLFHAAECGHLEITKLFLGHGKDAKERSWSGQPFFVDVASSDHLDVIRCFLEHGADANMLTISGRSIFILAVRRGSLEHIKLFTKFGGDVNSRDINGRPAMHIALHQDRLDVIDHLLKHGGDANAVDMTGTTLLLAAAQKKNYDLMELLLSRGANPNVSDMTGRSLILVILENPELEDAQKLDLLRMLLIKGVDANKSDLWGIPLMCHVMMAGNTDFLRVFLEHGGNPNNVLKRPETTLLLYALDERRDEQFELLLKHGADPNGTDKNGRTPLLETLQSEEGTHLLKQLLESGADVNRAGQVTPLAFAKLLSNQAYAQMLVARGAVAPTRTPAPTPTPTTESSHSLECAASSETSLTLASPASPNPPEMPPPYSNSHKVG